MDRLAFLKSMGFKGASLMAVLSSCVNPEDTYIEAAVLSTKDASGNPTNAANPITSTPSTPAAQTPISGNVTTAELSKITKPLLKIDLTTAAAKSLLTVGGYVIQSTIVVARTTANTFAAVTQTCTHQPKNKVIFSQGEFYCTDHGARFSLTGQPLNSVTRTAIAVYSTATDGKTLVVY